MAEHLDRGDLLPHVVTPPPGPESRRLSAQLEAHEAPGVSTVPTGGEAVVWEEALGSNVLDVDGNRYLDLTAGFGVAAIGHRHPEVVAAVRRQSETLLHGLGDVAAHPTRIELSRTLCRLAPVDDPRVYLAVSGADAVEVALKTAWLASGRTGVLAFEPSYHGTTLGALAATSRPGFRDPFRPQLTDHLHHLPFGVDMERVETLLGQGDFAAVIVEPVVGREGILRPPRGWLGALADVARQTGSALIADEVFTGFGRTGHRFAVDAEGVRPDLLVCGKAMGGGLPIAATIGRADLLEAWRSSAPGGEAIHTATFLGHPLATAAASAALAVFERDRLAHRANVAGQRIADRLRDWPERFGPVVECRGTGLMWGVEVTTRDVASSVVAAARARGILLLAGGPRGSVLQLTPPLVITEAQLDHALASLEEILHSDGSGPRVE